MSDDYYSMSNLELAHPFGSMSSEQREAYSRIENEAKEQRMTFSDYLYNQKKELDKMLDDEPEYRGRYIPNDIINLISEFGSETTLGEVLKRVQGKYTNLCPACKGLGYIEIEVNGYPDGLPDSGFVYEPKMIKEPCELCNGKGYTKIKYKPHLVQQGWEPEENS